MHIHKFYEAGVQIIIIINCDYSMIK